MYRKPANAVTCPGITSIYYSGTKIYHRDGRTGNNGGKAGGRVQSSRPCKKPDGHRAWHRLDSLFCDGTVAGATSISAAANAVLCGNLPFTVGSFSYNTGSATNNALNTSVSVMAFGGSTNVYSAGVISSTGGGIYFAVTYNI